MKIIFERKDYKSRKQLDVIGSRILKNTRKGFMQEHVGAPKETLQVSVYPRELRDVLRAALGTKVKKTNYEHWGIRELIERIEELEAKQI